MTRRLIWLSFFLTALCAQFAASQSKRDGSINGRILRDDGRPAAGVEISIRRISEPRGSERTTTSDEEGLFRFTNLAPAVYAIEAEVPGYIVDGASLRSNVYRTGEQATIRLTKGGVITLRGLSAGRYSSQPICPTTTGMFAPSVFRLRSPPPRNGLRLRRKSLPRAGRAG